MASTKFDVTPEEMSKSANMISEKTQQFIDAYRDIYTAVSELNVKYQGEASQVFNERIHGYENDFQAAEAALKNYSAFLESYAKDMTNVENDIKGRASKLSVGR